MAIPLIYLLRKSKAFALFVIAGIMSASTILRYQAVINNNLATVVYFGSEYASKLHYDLHPYRQWPFKDVIFFWEGCF